MRHTGPRNRLARRQGIDLELKTFGSKSQNRLARVIAVPPGQHGANTRRKISESGRQLREKQKLRFMFGITEKKLGSYFVVAKRFKGNTGHKLCEILEKRLDNVVYRAGFAPTRAAARQLVNHGHVLVNGKKNSIPSYNVKQDDVVAFRKADTAKIPYIETSLDRKDYEAPFWLERKGTEVKVVAVPSAETLEKQVNLRLIIEYYSK
ncbi:MAG: 30S ribosomal protein S4 [Patescibacteria group bacterium]